MPWMPLIPPLCPLCAWLGSTPPVLAPGSQSLGAHAGSLVSPPPTSGLCWPCVAPPVPDMLGLGAAHGAAGEGPALLPALGQVGAMGRRCGAVSGQRPQPRASRARQASGQSTCSAHQPGSRLTVGCGQVGCGQAGGRPVGAAYGRGLCSARKPCVEAFVSRGLSPLGVRDRSAQGLLWPTGCAQAAAALRPSIAPGRSAHRGGLPTAVPVPVAFQSLSVCPPSHRVPLPSGSAQGLVLACWPPDRGRAGASSTSMRLGGPWGAPGPSAVLVGRPWAGCGFAVDAGRSDSATCPGPGQLDSRSSRPCPFPREGGGRPAFPGAAVLATPQRGAGRRAGRRAHLCPSPHPAAGAAAHQSP